MFKSFPPEVIASLSTLELELLRYVNNHRADIINMSIQTLAKETFMSTTTIIRLCRKLNLDGYSHLKYFIKDQLDSGESLLQTYDETTLEDIISQELTDIQNTAQLLNVDDISAVANIIAKNDRIHFFAKGLTQLVFEYSARHLLSLSKHVTVYQDTHIAYIQVENFTDKDVVFLASMSGETQQVVRVAQIAKSKNATVITFTTNPSSPLAKLGNYNFNLINESKTTQDVDTKSRGQLMFVLNVLVKAFIQNNKKS